MRLTTATRAVGAVLARDLPATTPGAMPLLRAGTTITERFVTALVSKGIYAVWVDDALSEGIEPAELLPEPVRAEAAAEVHDALTAARTAFDRKQPLPAAALTELSSIVDLIASSIADSPDAALAMCDLAAADHYTHRHSVDVTALGLLLARTQFRRNGWTDFKGEQRFDRIDEQLTKLGMGLLLHDIGKMVVPAEVLNKPGKLSDEEWVLMRTHPDAGVALLATDTIGPLVKGVVRNHHERWNGSGYPRGLVGKEIGQFARIAAVADVYDAVTSERPYKSAMPAHKAVGIITSGHGTDFDPEVVDVFRRLVFPYPVGTEVEVEGRTAIVAANHPECPDEPLLRFPSPDGGEERRVDMREAAGVPAL